MTDLAAATAHIVATIPVRADALDLARSSLAEVEAATREEEGCLAYTAFESGAQPGLFITVGQWRSQDDAERHAAAPHIARAFEVLGPVLEGEVAIHPLRPLG